MGDVSINDASSTKCVNCGSIGLIVYACGECHKMVGCMDCINKINSKRGCLFPEENDGGFAHWDFPYFTKHRATCDDCFNQKISRLPECSKCGKITHQVEQSGSCWICWIEQNRGKNPWDVFGPYRS
jgi:hypothetical protein